MDLKSLLGLGNIFLTQKHLRFQETIVLMERYPVSGKASYLLKNLLAVEKNPACGKVPLISKILFWLSILKM